MGSFIYELFPDAEKNQESLEKAISDFYTVENIKPSIVFRKDFIEITIDTNRIEIEGKKFEMLTSLCENSKFDEAKILAEDLIDSNPNISEYHRILGQILSELGNQDEAINSLIYALRWNPKNEWALLMMGNIFAKYKNDIETALKYYDQVLVVKPNDCITLNNIGANLMQLDRKEEALKYFNKALESDPKYPNTYHALGLVAHNDTNYQKAFDYSLQALTHTHTRGT